MPLSVATLTVGEGGQLAGEVGPLAVAIEVAPSAPSFVLVKRKRDDATKQSGRKKSKAPMSLCTLRQVAGLGPTVGCLTTVQDVPPALPVVEALAAVTPTAVTPTASPPLAAIVQEDYPATVEVAVLATQAESVVVLSSTIVAPLLSIGVATTGAPMVLPPSSLALVVLPAVVLATMASPSLSLRLRFSLNYLYTSSDADSLWGVTYKLEQKTLTDFVLAFDKNLIRSTGVQNATDSTKVFLQRSLAILEENRLWHQEAVQKIASLEA